MSNLKIENKISPVIQYKGLVEIYSIDSNGKKHKLTKHNRGDIGLFNFITRALIGESLEKYRPSILKIYYKKDTQYEDALIVPIRCGTAWNRLMIEGGTAQVAKSSELSNAIQYVFTVVNSNIKSEAKTGENKIAKLELLNEDVDNNLCAEVTINDDDPDQILLNTTDNIIIYWRLLFTNVAE